MMDFDSHEAAHRILCQKIVPPERDPPIIVGLKIFLWVTYGGGGLALLVWAGFHWGWW